MNAGSRTSVDSAVEDSPLDSYQRLTVEQIMVDLTGLGVDDLILVESLEEAGAARGDVLLRIGGLLHALENPGDGPAPVVNDTPASVPNPVARWADASVTDDPVRQLIAQWERESWRRARVAEREDAPPPASPTGVKARSRGRHLLVGLVVVALTATAGALLLGHVGHPRAPAPRAQATADPPAVAGGPAVRLVPGVSGYNLQSVGDTTNGPSELARVVAHDGGADAEAALTGAGFLHSYERLWENTPDRQILLSVYQFDTNAGAVSYARRLVDSDRATLKASTSEFTIRGIPGAIGRKSSGSGARATALFSRGHYVVRIIANLPEMAGETALLQQLADQQYALL